MAETIRCGSLQAIFPHSTYNQKPGTSVSPHPTSLGRVMPGFNELDSMHPQDPSLMQPLETQ